MLPIWPAGRAGDSGKVVFPLKKLFESLPAKLLLGVVVGILVGLGCSALTDNGSAFGPNAMQVILTVKTLMGSVISFCVPLIVIGFIAPSITRLKSNASRMLGAHG